MLTSRRCDEFYRDKLGFKVHTDANLFGNLVQTERMVVAVIDEVTCPRKPLECLDVHSARDIPDYGFGGNGFCNAAAINSGIPASLLL